MAQVLTRTTFRTSRLLDFLSREELVAQTGHRQEDWLLVVLKELTDNSLDACEEARIPPVIEVVVDKEGPHPTLGPRHCRDRRRRGSKTTEAVTNQRKGLQPSGDSLSLGASRRAPSSKRQAFASPRLDIRSQPHRPRGEPVDRCGEVGAADVSECGSLWHTADLGHFSNAGEPPQPHEARG
jgi:hypothetical protein